MTTNAAENATAGVPVVRGLEWENGKAVSPIGRYSIQRTPDGYAAVWEHEELAHFGFNTDDPFQEAKKTVEADYEQRILSALNPDFLSELDTARAEIERLRERLRDIIDERDNLSTIIATEIDDVAGAELDDMEERATRAESALTAAQARIAELEAALGSVEREYVTEYAGRSYTRCTCCHVALSDGQPHLTNCAWTTLSPAVKEPK